MNYRHYPVYLLMVCMLLGGNTVVAQDRGEHSFTVTANPSFYILGGYSVKGYYILPKRWSFGLAVEAGFEIPDFARDQFFANNDDIAVNWDFLVGVEAVYRFTDSAINKGLFTQVALGYEGWTITSDGGEEDDFQNWYASLGAGYNWFPFKKPNFFLGGTYSLIFILNETDEREAGESVYNIRPVVPPSLIPTIHVGWRF
ncbi:MAG: hypothetical protein AAGA85_24475 [Bacteroidota bacterium]